MMRNFSQTLLNVLGLAIGMTCALLIFLWVQNQLNYDQWQKKKENIYRLEYSHWVIMPPYLGDIVNELPEVEDMVRFFFWYQPTLTYEKTAYNVDHFAYADSSVFNVFTFDFIYGNPKDALANPFSVVLTKKISDKLFGDENPMGKTLLMNNDITYTVTGVIEDVKNLHLEINAIVAAQDAAKLYGNNRFLEARNHNWLIYLLVNKNTDIKALQEKINKITTDDGEYDEQQDVFLLLRPFTGIYFERGLPNETFVKHGNFNLVLIFSAISVLILVIACINFINITTAKVNLREKEIGIRKIVGANRKKITIQFLGETFFMVLVAHIISIVLLEFILPKFNMVTNEYISFDYLSSRFLLIVISIVIVTTVLSGIYPSIYLSSLKPVLIMKGKSGQRSKGNLRMVLMVIQFVISIFLIISTIIILKQLNFVLKKDLGWNQENIVTFELKGDKFSGKKENYIKNKDAFNTELFKNHNIISATYLNQYPGKITNTSTLEIEGELYPLKFINADPDFVKTMDIEIVKGRNFSYDHPGDLDNTIILNETAVKFLGLEDPITTITSHGREIHVIGVVKDFNFNSLHSKIIPMAISWDYWTSRACVRISGNDIPNTLKRVKSLYNEFCPKYPFEYEFMDEQFARQYENEMKQSRILVFFACIAIFIAGLGLFGMSSFISATRIKEIGIRKALGSSTLEIMVFFSGSFMRWILIAFLIASPAAYYLVNKWLMQYPYKTGISWWVFLTALIISILIAFITIGFQIIRSARTNPAECLRYE